MKTKYYITVILVFMVIPLKSQFTIFGHITDRKGLPLIGANVSLKNTYDGATADTAGYFSFSVTDTGRKVLVVSYIGFKSMETNIYIRDSMHPLLLTMEEQPGEINSVVITAGAFETGELKRPIVLKPMDIATTPSAVGDIFGALTTLPGTQIVGDEGGLYVRGGEGYETKTFIDGMLVNNPYFSEMPDLPTRCRFSPVLFTGTAFSTGGYTAEYGQALSSAVNLNTAGLSEKNQGTISLMSVGMSGSYSLRFPRTSVSGTLQYTNMQPYHELTGLKKYWHTSPSQLGGTLLFRQKFGKYGMLKIFGTTDNNGSALYYKFNGDTTESQLIRLHSSNHYINAVYNDMLTEKWRVKTGFSFGQDQAVTRFDQNSLKDKTVSFQQRITLVRETDKGFQIKLGEEISGTTFSRGYYAFDSAMTYRSRYHVNNFAFYMEPEVKLGSRFILRPGLRSEFMPVAYEYHLVPRISMALKTGDYSQFSLAAGRFSQRPENPYYLYARQLKSEKATHLILNYQYEVDNRIFRAEIYRKWYDNLVKFKMENDPYPWDYSNSGNGFAEGIDLFWRDSKSIRNLDYWISYSFIHTRRDYKWYSNSRTPSYISPHTFSAVFKYFFQRFDTYTSLTYLHASPKTSYNPYAVFAKGDRVKSYNDISFSITCIRPFLGSYCALLLNINNVLGFDNTFGYNYATTSDATGSYARYPIKPQSKRFIVFCAYIILE
jgi:hypothetical protein